MRPKLNIIHVLSIVFVLILSVEGEDISHTFNFDKNEFLLDGKPFQIISGELHPARIPVEYWQHRIQMAKAMGCNTIAAYIFWNYHEAEKGKFDFSTGNKNLPLFFKTVHDEGMWLLLRPGPYVCAEWDFGGLPPYLLTIPDIKVRCMDERYMRYVERYIEKISKVIKPYLISRNGPILMLQLENEYGSYGNDKRYMSKLKKLWEKNGIKIPFFTADGPTQYMLEVGTLPGVAVGLDSGRSDKDFELAKKMNPGVPVFSSETYTGWLTHWGEKWARPDPKELFKEVKFLLKNRRSFNLFVIHGGTNFGFSAGANHSKNGYEPDVTSYDYDAPINEQGRPTSKYHALRNLIASHLPRDHKLPPVPSPIPVTKITEINIKPYTSIWNNLPEPLFSVQPGPFESYGQFQGLILYRTKLIGHRGGKLTVTELHDYATIFLNGKYIGNIDRRKGERAITLPDPGTKAPELDILAEGMGRINYGEFMIDRKGITSRVTLNRMTLMNWKIYKFPLQENFIKSLKESAVDRTKPGIFFRGIFYLKKAADTYIDLSNYRKGIVWVNGHNLGRFWEIGPQKRLYCTAPFLKRGKNSIIILDILQTRAMPVKGFEKPEG